MNINSGRDRKKYDDKDVRLLVGVLGAITTFAMAFFIAGALEQSEDAQLKAQTFEQLKEKWHGNNRDKKGNKAYYPLTEYRKGVDDIIKKAEGLFQREKIELTHQLALLVLGFVAGGVAVAGALSASEVLMIAGVALGIFAAAGAAYKMGRAYFNTFNQEEARAINIELQEVEKLNQQVDVFVKREVRS